MSTSKQKENHSSCDASQERELRLELRSFESADESFAQLLYNTTRNDIHAFPFSEAEKTFFLQQQYQMRKTHYQQVFPDACTDILIFNGDPVGKLTALYDPRQYHIIDIAILPGYRRLAIASTVLGQVIEKAISNNVPSIQLRVNQENNALNLYRRLGFKVIADEQIKFLMERKIGSTEPALSKSNLTIRTTNVAGHPLPT